MYADRDRAGHLSIMEMTHEEELLLMEAISEVRDYYEQAYFLFSTESNEEMYRQKYEILRAMFNRIQSV